jgi:hypothetical protein
MDTIYMTTMFTPRQDELFRSVAKLIKEVEAFEYEGVIFNGNRNRAAIEFAWNNPTGGDFYVWLQDNYPILKK